MAHTSPSDDAIAELIASERHREGAILPILHRIQAAFGHVPETAVPLIAEALNIGRAEVHGVISFYHDFRAQPAGRHVLKICRAEACQAVGGAALGAEVLARLGTGWHGTTDDGGVTVEPVFCLGLCANGPAAMIDDRPVAGLGADQLIAKVSP